MKMTALHTRPIIAGRTPFHAGRISSMVLAGLLFGLTACETGVDPVIETDVPFSMYGLFNPLSDTQAVRVYPVDGTLIRNSGGALGAIVTSTNLDTGEQHSWTDSVVTFDNGEIGHVFWSDLQVDFEERYRLVVERADGRQSEVSTVVPPFTNVVAEEGDAGTFELPIPVTWDRAPNLIDITVTYRTTGGVSVAEYGIRQTEVDGGRQVIINFREDTRQILLEAIVGGSGPVRFDEIEVSAVVTNSDWVPPDGRFDPNILVEPGTFSNVENGFGFVGSGYRTTIQFRPTDEMLIAAGFSTELPDDR